MSDDPEKEVEETSGGGGYGMGGYGTGPYGGLRKIYKIPASETPEGKERLRAYYEALGRFVDMFSIVEAAVTFTLRAYAKTTPAISKVIFAGIKVDVGTNYIKQLAAAINTPKDICDDLVNVFQQLGTINNVRNGVLHYGAVSIAEGSGFVSDEIKAKGEPTVFPISNITLDDMTADLSKIATHLNYRHLGRTPPLGAFGKAALEEILQRAWRYKHPSPPRAPSKKEASRPQRVHGPKPTRQPGS
jgi:hypothetical protein